MKLKTLLASGVIASLFGMLGTAKSAKATTSRSTKALVWAAWGLGLASAIVSAWAASTAEDPEETEIS
jgi:FtsH-binding integral membrane protein